MKNSLAVLFIVVLNIQVGFGQTTTDSEKKKVVVPRVAVYFPSWAGGDVSYTAFNGILSKSEYERRHGKISSFGYGGGLDGIINKNLRITFDFHRINYKQEIAEEMGTVSLSHLDPFGGLMLMPLGIKYKAQTLGIKAGVKYVVDKKENIKPWVGLSYGIYIYDIKYVTWDESMIYGQTKGNTGRLTYGAGVDFIMTDFGTLTLFADANAPAPWTNITLLGYEYFEPGSITYPPLRFGIAFGDF